MNAMRGCWEMVVEIYKRDPRSYNIKIGVSGDTALHMAIMSRQEDTAQKLVQLIIYTRTENDALDVLSTPNKQGNTSLHLAAALGSVNLCKSILDYSHTEDGSIALQAALANGFWGKTTTSTLF